MQIVDELNSGRPANTPIVKREVVRVVRKKLSNKSLRVVDYALSLAETMVKNCGIEVHREIATQPFMDAISAVARKHAFKTSVESRKLAAKALDLIQSWGEAFLPQRRELPLFVETYHRLRTESLPFPEQYQDRPPVLAPAGPGNLLDQQARSAQQPGVLSESPSLARPAPATTSREEEELIGSVESAAEMLKSMVEVSESASEVRDNDIISQLVTHSKELGPQLSQLIEKSIEGAPELLERLLVANDALEASLELHDAAVGGRLDLPVMKTEVEVSHVGQQMENLLLNDDTQPPALNVRKAAPVVPLLQPPPGVPALKVQKLDQQNPFSASLQEQQVHNQSQSMDLLDFASSLPPSTSSSAAQDPYYSGNVQMAAVGDQQTSENRMQSLLDNLGALYGSSAPFQDGSSLGDRPQISEAEVMDPFSFLGDSMQPNGGQQQQQPPPPQQQQPGAPASWQNPQNLL
jgi:hypothetical protein